MKKHPEEYNFDTCWCGCDRSFHTDYVEYTGYSCSNCSKCNDFGLTVNG
jgi:hypothetical protein